MLKSLRKNRNSLVGLLIVGVVSVLMLSFGLDFYSGPSQHTEAIVVNDREISSRQYSLRLSQLQNLFRRQFRENYAQIESMLNLPQRTVDDLVNTTLLEQFISKLGFSASTSQIENRIASHPFFGGMVTKVSYDSFLRSQGLTGIQLEEITKQEIVTNQLSSLFSDISSPTEEELKKAYLAENKKMAFSYLAFPAKRFEDKVELSDENALKNYFAEHSERYRIPRKVQYIAIEFAPKDYLNMVEVLEEDIKEAYQQKKHLLTEPAKIQLRQIFIAKKNQASELEKLVTGEESLAKDSQNDAGKALIETIEARLDSGEPFAELARELSEDNATAEKGGDLGMLLFSELAPEIREAAANLSDGEHSEAISSKEGYYLIYAEKRVEKRTKDYSEVREELEQELRNSDAPQYAQAAAVSFKNDWDTSGAEQENRVLADYAKEQGKNIILSIRPLGSGEAPEGAAAELTEHALSLKEKEDSVFDVGDTSYLIQAQKVIPAHIPDFASVSKQVEAAYIAEQSNKLAKEAAEKALEALKEDSKLSLASLASKYNLEEVELTELADRATASGPLFLVPGATQALFSTTEGTPVVDQVLSAGSTYYLAKLVETKLPEMSEFEEKKSEVQAAEIARSSRRLMDSLMLTLKARADIWVNPELLDRQL